MITWARALHDGGDERAKRVRVDAVALARELDDTDRFAAATLVRSDNPMGSWDGTRSDTEFVAILEEALERVPDEPSPVRARLLSQLAIELFWTPQTERRRALARESVEMARETQDPTSLALALGRAWTLVDGSRPFSDEMEALFDEGEIVAERAGHLTALVNAYRSKAFAAGCRGDRVEMERIRSLSRPLVEQLRLPQLRAGLINDDAAFAAFAGDLDAAERLTFEGVEAGSAAGISEAGRVSILGALLYQILLCKGRVGELADLLTERVEASPDAPVWRVALAGALVESDRIDEARPHFDFLTADECANVLPDIEFPVIMCGLGRLSFRIEPDPAALRPVYEKLMPFAGSFNWSGSTITDANDQGLALAAATLGEHEAADAHFTAALDLCRRAGARAYEARCIFDWARVLDARGDAARARPLAEQALELGTELGMDGPSGIVPRAQALLA
jgi:hypothetical protein